MQYIDATGSIDAVIPDIPSTWDSDAIYEVLVYDLFGCVKHMPHLSKSLRGFPREKIWGNSEHGAKYGNSRGSCNRHGNMVTE